MIRQEKEQTSGEQYKVRQIKDVVRRQPKQAAVPKKDSSSKQKHPKQSNTRILTAVVLAILLSVGLSIWLFAETRTSKSIGVLSADSYEDDYNSPAFEYSEEFKDNYIKTCNQAGDNRGFQTGATESYCYCMLAKIQSNFSEKDYKQIEKEMIITGDAPMRVEELANECGRENLS